MLSSNCLLKTRRNKFTRKDIRTSRIHSSNCFAQNLIKGLVPWSLCKYTRDTLRTNEEKGDNEVYVPLIKRRETTERRRERNAALFSNAKKSHRNTKETPIIHRQRSTEFISCRARLITNRDPPVLALCKTFEDSETSVLWNNASMSFVKTQKLLNRLPQSIVFLLSPLSDAIYVL